MKIEGKVHLNMDTYKSIVIGDTHVIVASDVTVKSNNNDFTKDFSKLDDATIKHRIIMKYISDCTISSISSKQYYKDKAYITIKDINGRILKIYNCPPAYLNMFIEEYYKNFDNCLKNNIEIYNFCFSTSESGFNVTNNTMQINIIKLKDGKPSEEDYLQIKKTLNKLISEDLYEVYENGKYVLITNGKQIIFDMDLYGYEKIYSYIELLKRQKGNAVRFKLKK